MTRIGDILPGLDCTPRDHGDGCYVLRVYPLNERHTKTYVLPGVFRSREKIHQVVRDAINACVTGSKPWPLYLWGEVGVGKTFAAACLADATVGAVRFRTEDQAYEESNQANYHELRDSDGKRVFPSNIRYWWQSCELAVLDDFGKALMSDARTSVMLGVLDARTGKPLVITANRHLKDLTELVDDRVLSRAAAGTIIEYPGPDRRTQR